MQYDMTLVVSKSILHTRTTTTDLGKVLQVQYSINYGCDYDDAFDLVYIEVF